MSIELDISGSDEVAEAIDNLAQSSEDAVKEEIENTAHKVWNTTRDNAPEVTGDLVDSYQLKLAVDGLDAKIFSRLDYAARIELGFQGTDALGREYDQQGQYPMTDAFEEETDGFAKRARNRT